MRIEKLSWEHRELLRDRLRNARCGLSEYSFANLFLFRSLHDYHVLTGGDRVFIRGKTYDGFRYLMPTAPVTPDGTGALIAAARDCDFIFPVPGAWLPALEARGGKADFVDGDSDYIYAVEKLVTYEGHKLHGQKGLLRQFLDAHTPAAVPLTRGQIPDALAVLETWQQDVGTEKQATDYYPCLEGLTRYDELGLCGGIYYVEGEPAGFVIGEEVRPDMFALHFAKGIRKFKGLYQYMYHHFATILPRRYAFLNFEQDLGNLALRIAKSSYDPDHILKKYRVRFAT